MTSKHELDQMDIEYLTIVWAHSSSSPRRGPGLTGAVSIAAPVRFQRQRMLCGSCTRSLTTERYGRFTESRRSGRRRTEDRTLAGPPVSCSTVVPPGHRTGDHAPSAGACWRRGGSRCSRSTTRGTGAALVLQHAAYARRAAVRSRGEWAEGASEGFGGEPSRRHGTAFRHGSTT